MCLHSGTGPVVVRTIKPSGNGPRNRMGGEKHFNRNYLLLVIGLVFLYIYLMLESRFNASSNVPLFQ